MLQTQYPYIELHNYVVMPNHVHILFGIDSSLIERTARELSQHELSVQDPIKIKSVSSIMEAFKTTTSKQIHLLGNLHFEWQRSFHDHIVRNAKAYDNIFNYITDNPNRWKENTFNEDCDVNHVENE